MVTKLSTKATKAMFVAACLFGAACTGTIGGDPSPGSGNASPSGSAGSRGSGSAGSLVTGPASLLNLPAAPLPTTALHKLTAWEFANSVEDLLGSDVPLSPVEADTLIGGFATVGSSSVSISPAGVGQYETVLGTATAHAFADAKQASSILSCMPQATTDTACLTKALNAFGRRAFRRPLTSAETTLFLNLATAIGNQSGSSVLTGIRYAVLAMLESPGFLYRVEVGSSRRSGCLRIRELTVRFRRSSTSFSTPSV